MTHAEEENRKTQFVRAKRDDRAGGRRRGGGKGRKKEHNEVFNLGRKSSDIWGGKLGGGGVRNQEKNQLR